MTKSKNPKPRAWRGFCSPEVKRITGFAPVVKPLGAPPNCTVIPDGADPPLPPSVRRVMRAAERWAKHPGPEDSSYCNLLFELRSSINIHVSRKRKP